MIKALASKTWVHILVGAVLMGSWALFANRQHGLADAIPAAAIQAVLSGFLTGFLKTLADRLLNILNWAVAAGLSLLSSATLLSFVHWAAGTPELRATIAVPLIVSGSYIFGYCFIRRGPTHG